MSRLHDLYTSEIVDAMVKKFGYKNIMEVPKLDKIVINMGVGEAKDNSKILDVAVKELETIAGQKAVLTRAKNSVANFKIREGMPIGCKVTLRGERMYEFLDRLVNLALPRVRDFRGVSADSFASVRLKESISHNPHRQHGADYPFGKHAISQHSMFPTFIFASLED